MYDSSENISMNLCPLTPRITLVEAYHVIQIPSIVEQIPLIGPDRELVGRILPEAISFRRVTHREEVELYSNDVVQDLC